MNTQIFFFLSIAVFLGIMCIAVLVFGAFIYFFINRVSQFNTTLHAELSFPPIEDFLASAALRGWETGAFSDLSCRWKGEWSDITRQGRYEGYTRGVVKSLRDPDGPGWIAFVINSDHRKERDGLIVLVTSAQRVELKVRGQRLNPNVQVQASINGIERGAIAVTHPNCNYQSMDRTTEAQWTPIFRPKRAYALNKLIVYDPVYYPLTVNNRPIASLADMWIRNPQVGSQKPFPAALQSISGDLNDSEQGILLIMIGMSLYFDSLHIRRLRYDW